MLVNMGPMLGTGLCQRVGDHVGGEKDVALMKALQRYSFEEILFQSQQVNAFPKEL